MELWPDHLLPTRSDTHATLKYTYLLLPCVAIMNLEPINLNHYIMHNSLHNNAACLSCNVEWIKRDAAYQITYTPHLNMTAVTAPNTGRKKTPNAFVPVCVYWGEKNNMQQEVFEGTLTLHSKWKIAVAILSSVLEAQIEAFLLAVIKPLSSLALSLSGLHKQCLPWMSLCHTSKSLLIKILTTLNQFIDNL